ncbi:MAG: serine/threonine protein kinase [Deltaproteobacteria bacterium]|nr:serine/threonine protein kinase [Deltaproteobacteria bacterium]
MSGKRQLDLDGSMKVCPRCSMQTREAIGRCPSDGTRLLELGQGDPLFGVIAGGSTDSPGSGFLILNLIGAGAMGTVYRAYQASLDREVAVKVLSGPEVRDPESIERFRREAMSCAQLHSPHTISVYERGELPGGGLFIAMELLFGRSLDQIIKSEAPLQTSRLVDLAKQVCRSLEEAHSRGIVHRDIKPSNIMVEGGPPGSEHAKVLDFGLVKLLGANQSLTSPGGFCGTPLYMAPELWSSQYGDIGPAADLYALGVVMFQMLTGKSPFAATTVPELIHKHLYESPAPCVLMPDTDGRGAALEKLIGRCLRKRAEERFASAAELRDALESEFAPTGPMFASPPTVELAQVSMTRRAPPMERSDGLGPLHLETTVRYRHDRPWALASLLALLAVAFGVRSVAHAPATSPLSTAPLVRGSESTEDSKAKKTERAEVEASVARPAAHLTAPAEVPPSFARLPEGLRPRPAEPPTSTGEVATPRSSTRARVTGVRVIGGLPLEEAKKSLLSIEPDLAVCYEQSGSGARVTIHFVVAPEGRVMSVNASEGAPEALRTCVLDLRPKFVSFAGSRFSTVSFEVGA